MLAQEKLVPGVLIATGDRNWGALPKEPTEAQLAAVEEQERRITRFLRDFKFRHSVVFLLVGDCRGADQMVATQAKTMGYKVEVFKADWKRWGNGAGPLRNGTMISRGLDWRGAGARVETVAFHDDIEHSRGTKNCVTQAHEAGITVKHG